MQVQDFSLKALGARDETTMSDSRLVARFQSWGSPQKFDHGAELSGRASTPPNPEGIPRPLHYPGNRFFAGPIFLLTPRPKFQQQFHSGAKLSGGGAGSVVVAEIELARWRGGQSDRSVPVLGSASHQSSENISQMLKFCFDVDVFFWWKVVEYD